tara:strand:- start:1250 stop:2089 length:840 start_codon:yes stop_codon:yes gene_type:complete
MNRKIILKISITFQIIFLFSFLVPVFSAENKNPILIMKTNYGTISLELFHKKAPKTVRNFIRLATNNKKFIHPVTGKTIKPHFYDGLTFHRVIKDFMIQGGCPKGNGTGGPGYKFEDEINANSLGLHKIKAYTNSRPHPYLGISSQRDFHLKLIKPLLNSLKITTQEQFNNSKTLIFKKLDELSVKDALKNLGYKYSEKLKSEAPLRGFLAMANSGPNTNGSQFFINLVNTPWLRGKHTVFGKVKNGMSLVDKIGNVSVDRNGKPDSTVIIQSIRKKEK